MDAIKDQSFFLCHLKKSVLPLIEFPIGHIMKHDVKRLASEMNLEKIAKKDESGRDREFIFEFILLFKVWVCVLLANESSLDLFLNTYRIMSVL